MWYNGYTKEICYENIATKAPAFAWMGLAVTAVTVLVANLIIGGLFLYLCGLFISLISVMSMVADAVLCIIRARIDTTSTAISGNK